MKIKKMERRNNMLANGAKLAIKKSEQTTWVELPGLKEIPEMGSQPEKVETTTLSDSVKQYEQGIGDAGDLVYKFKYDNSMADSPYRVLREIQTDGEVVTFKETLKDGTATEFKGQVSVKRTGGGVNAVLEFTANITLQSELSITDPS